MYDPNDDRNTVPENTGSPEDSGNINNDNHPDNRADINDTGSPMTNASPVFPLNR